MVFEVERRGETERTIRIEVSAKDLRKQLESELHQLSRRVKIPGFRPGKVPMSILEKRFGAAVKADAMRGAVEREYQKAIQENQLRPVQAPSIADDQLKPDEQGAVRVELEVEVLPPLVLKDYKGLRATVPDFEVTDEHVDTEIQKLRMQHSSVQEVADRPAQKDDMLVADLIYRFADGGSIPEQKSRTLHLERGEVDRIPCEELKTKGPGATIGSVLKLSVVLPDDFPIPAVRGKDAQIDCIVTKILKVVMPDAGSAEFLAKFEDVKTEAGLRDVVRSSLLDRVREQRDRMIEDMCVEQLIDRHPFSLPPKLRENAIQSERERLRRRLLDNSAAIEEIERHLLEVEGRLRDKVEHDLRAAILLSRVAEAESIQVSEAEMEAQLRVMSAMMQIPIQDLVEIYQRPDKATALLNNIREVKARRLLRTSAVTSESEKGKTSAGSSLARSP